MALVRNLSIALFIANSLSAMSIPREAVFSPARLGDVEVSFKDSNFSVNDKSVQRCDLEKVLREVSSEDKLKALLSNVRLSVSQYDNGEYKLATIGGLNGGGPILAWAGYCVLKVVPVTIAAIAGHKAKKRHRHQDTSIPDSFEDVATLVNLYRDPAGELVDQATGRVIESGDSFLIDSQGRSWRQNYTSADDSMFVAINMADPRAVAHAGSWWDGFCNATFDLLNKVPGKF